MEEHGANAFFSILQKYGAIGLSVTSLLVLIHNPVPFCVDCDYPDPWRHQDGRYDWVVMAWLVLAPFLAGMLPLKAGWSVPVTSVLGLVFTQPLGGVEFWSLLNNEGPFILIAFGFITGCCFATGWFVRSVAVLVIQSIRKSILRRTA